MNGSTFKRCGCRDASGKLLGQKCPKLRSTKHGTWYYQLRVAGRSHPYKRGGFPSARKLTLPSTSFGFDSAEA